MDLSGHDPDVLARWACQFNLFHWPEDFPIPRPEGWDLWTDHQNRRIPQWHSKLKARFPEFMIAVNAVRSAADHDKVMEFWRENHVPLRFPQRPPRPENSGLSAKQKAEDFSAMMGPLVKDLWNNGLTLQSIANRLNMEGYVTYRGAKWSKMQVKRVLNAIGIETAEEHPRAREMEIETQRIGNAVFKAVGKVGTGWRRLLKELNQMGIRNRYGRPLSRCTIESILKKRGPNS